MKSTIAPAVMVLMGLVSQLTAAPASRPAGEHAGRPQYIFFNRAPSRAEGHWDQTLPERFTAASLREVVAKVGGPGTGRLRVGVHFPFSILERDLDVTAESLRRMLQASSEANVPILVTLDGQNWWQTRSDLWNWWDPKLPGYDPRNRLNVEWTGWGPEHAVKIGWRNWGHQLRVRPAPNLASPRFLAEHWKAYDRLIPIVLAWYRSLPPGQRDLFGGLKLGWEASINVNAFYYPNGNAIFEAHPNDASGDPNDHDAAKGWTFGHRPPLGYAAVSTAGVRRAGELTKADIERVVQQYLERLARAAVERGVPKEWVFTHQGGTYAPWEEHLSFRPAINAYSVPGWSFYSHDPAECGSLAADLKAAGREEWAASEWWRGGPDVATWRARFEATLRFKRCRFICVYNWESFVTDGNALEAVRTLVGNRP